MWQHTKTCWVASWRYGLAAFTWSATISAAMVAVCSMLVSRVSTVQLMSTVDSGCW